MNDKSLLILIGILILSPLLFDLVKVITSGRWDLALIFRPLAFSIAEGSGITENNSGEALDEIVRNMKIQDEELEDIVAHMRHYANSVFDNDKMDLKYEYRKYYFRQTKARKTQRSASCI